LNLKLWNFSANSLTESFISLKSTPLKREN